MNAIFKRPLTWVLSLVLLVLVGLLVSGLFAPRTITIDARGMPLAQVIRSFERQGGIPIRANIDPAMPVTLQLVRAPVLNALRALGVAVRAEFRIAYAFAPNSKALNESLESWEKGAFQGMWLQLQGPMVGPPKVHPKVDEWIVKPEADASLAAYLKQASVHTGLCIMLSGDGAVPVAKPPASGTVDRSLRRLAKIAGMKCDDFALLIARGGSEPDGPGHPDGPGGGPPPPPPPGGTRDQNGGGPPNPHEIVAFLKSRISELPADRRAEADTKVAEMEALLQTLKDLPPPEQAAVFSQKIRLPGGPGGGPPPGSGSGGMGSSTGGSGERSAEKYIEKLESTMDPTQRSEFSRSYVEKKAASE
jgi:hypothetical protein